MIDFQAHINTHLWMAARRIADEAITSNNRDYAWSHSSHCYGDHVFIQVWNSDILADEHRLDEIPSMKFDLTGRTVDASLLEQLYNEVTAWFLRIKSIASHDGVYPCAKCETHKYLIEQMIGVDKSYVYCKNCGRETDALADQDEVYKQWNAMNAEAKPCKD